MDDGWEVLPRARGARLGVAALLVVALVGVGIAVARTIGRARPSEDLVVGTATPDPSESPVTGPWTALPAAPRGGREGHAAVWTGSEVLYVGGLEATAPDAASTRPDPVDALAFDPAARTWRPLPSGPLAARAQATAVWTGTQVLVWGGEGTDGPVGDGARLDPTTASWTTMAAAPLTARSLHTAVWTGTEMLVWAGDFARDAPDGAAYEPATDRWRPLPAAPLTALGGQTATWTGTEMIVAGGLDGTGATPAEAAAYDPAGDSWRRLPAPPVAGRTLQAAVWTGSELVVWGGETVADGTSGPRADGAAYEPSSDSWRTLPEGPLSPRFGLSAVWSGREVILWGGVGARFTPDGARFDPVTDRWTAIPPAPVHRPVQYPAVWTGRQMLIWAGIMRPSGAALELPPVDARPLGCCEAVGGVLTAPVAASVAESVAASGGRVSRRFHAAPHTAAAVRHPDRTIR